MEITRTWYLELDGTPLATPAWECPDLSPLLDSPALRGSDRTIPTLDGVVPYARRVTAMRVTLALDVFGAADAFGAPAADRFEQLNLNMEQLRAQFEPTVLEGEGTVTAILYRGDLDPWIADVQFLGFRGSRTAGIELLRTTFDLSIPAGRFEATGSS